MIGIVPVIGSHVPGQPLNVFGSFAGISRFQPGTFLARQENILKLSISAARTLYSFGLTMFFIFCISITCGQFLPIKRGGFLHF